MAGPSAGPSPTTRAAEQVASQINLELTASAPTRFSFRPISVAELQRAFFDYHEGSTAIRRMFLDVATAGAGVLKLQYRFSTR
jgi:hypothetical protein